MGDTVSVRTTLVVLVLLLTSTGCGTLLGDPASSLDVDKDALAQVHRRLQPVVAALSSVNNVVHTKQARPAEFVGCSVDSGDIFQPIVQRQWPLTASARTRNVEKFTRQGRDALADITAQMIAKGWKLAHENDRYAFTGVTKSFGDHKIGVSIQAFNNAVLATAKTYPSPRVCRRQ